MAERWKSRYETEDQGATTAVDHASQDASDQANAESETLKQTAQSLLRASPFQELHAVDVVIEDGGLRLRGQVMSFFHKQIAQETIRSVAPGGVVENDLEVHPGHRLH